MAGMTRFDIEPAYACLSCMRQVPSFEVWQRHTERGLVFTHHAADGHPVVRIVFREQQAQAPPASDPPRLGCESPSNCDLKLDLCTHCQARTAPNGLTPPSWITARQSDPPGLVANWRPIETAPKRTDVLAGWADRPHWLPQVLQQDDAGMWFNGEESDYRPPTHWMPLPAAPQAETKGDE